MAKLPICRICLNANVRHAVKDPQLQEIYERLTAITTTDMRPLTLCYICHAQLNASRRLMLKCLKTEELLTQMLNQLQANEDEAQTAILIDQSAVNQLTVSSIELIVLDGTVETDDIEDKKPLRLINELNIKLEEQNMQDNLEAAGGVDAESDMEHNLSDAGDLTLETVNEQEEVKVEKTEQNELEQAPIAKKIGVVSEVNKSSEYNEYVKTGTDCAKAEPSKPKYNYNISDPTVTDNILSNKIIDCTVLSNMPAAVNSYEIKECINIEYSCRITSDLEKYGIDQEKVISHARVDTARKSCVCSVCEKSFKNKRYLWKHVSRMHGEKLFICDFCNKRFNNRGNIIKHIRTHAAVKAYVCNICNMRFTVNSRLRAHATIHTGEKPYVCNVCGKSFRQNYSLAMHAKTHTGEKPYACGDCPKSFAHHHSLLEHARIHTGEKPYACRDCGKSFYRKCTLTIHLRSHKRVHPGERYIVCDVCGKSFYQMGDLTKHKRVHTRVKPYVCSVCKKGFSQRSNLKRHERGHTGVKP